MNRTKYLLYFLMLCGVLGMMVQCKSGNSLKESAPSLKVTEMRELEDKMKVEKRNVLLFFKTSWCTYCKNMEINSFREPKVVRLLNEGYYFVPFDAEQKEALEFQGKRYTYVPTGRGTGTHELASMLGTEENHLSYPTVVLLDTAFQVTFRHDAFISGADLAAVLEQLSISGTPSE